MGDHAASTDFTIRCLPEDVAFPIQKLKFVEGSETFADMFMCCDAGGEEKSPRSVDLYESVNDMALLVRLIEDPPQTLSEAAIREGSSKQSLEHPTALIPYLLLPRLFALAEKYALKLPVTQILRTHLLAQASIAPLLVYGLAIQYSLPEIADQASKFLAFTPLERYSMEDIKIIPSAEAYHKLLQLQSYRKRRIKELLMNEDLFPHGYGACSAHKDYAEVMWDKRRRSILPNVHSGSDVAKIMSRRLDAKIRTCNVCKKAWVAATEMLAYKCRKVARRVTQMDKEVSN
ncbi:hypothetical protein A7U60_g7880 [Sanghuangporus baumii]|uniref:BTB domain-containing protein n=1 Tax=Sanghuangporus baumii TaxID=108892 RepID=A0A9Q5HSL5_SANBA|nr:hypothetical protein A7U60_g7880 [Sanghuangporus baumii]